MAHQIRLVPIAPWAETAEPVAETAVDTRWLSYDELAEIAGIKRESVTQMVRRKKWPKRTGNEPGSVRIAVPVIAIGDMQARRIARPESAETPPPETPFDLTVIALAVRKLETALHDVRTERDQLRVELERERETVRLLKQDDELTRVELAEERVRTADQHTRLNAQIATLAGELARLHAVTRSPAPEPAATPVPFLSRVGSTTRWFRS